MSDQELMMTLRQAQLVWEANEYLAQTERGGAGYSLAKHRLIQLFSALLLLLVIWHWGSAGWIYAKAQLAQWLIADAWAEMREDNQSTEIKPWPWADTYPVARLRMADEGVDLFVLEGAQGNSLAFGPGHMQGTALPGEGISVIGGHRDTHFNFLKDVAVGQALELETRNGRSLSYRITRMEVVDIRQTPLNLPAHYEEDTSALVLVTCYPFAALTPNGPLRLVVWAEEVSVFKERHEFEEPQETLASSMRYAHLKQGIFSL
jgi:sortase A